MKPLSATGLRLLTLLVLLPGMLLSTGWLQSSPPPSAEMADRAAELRGGWRETAGADAQRSFGHASARQAYPASRLAPESESTTLWYWSRLAFQAYTGDYEVYFTNGVGLNGAVVAPSPANDGRARLNRGSTQIVFTSNRDGDFEVFKVNVDGSGLTQLTVNHNTDARPAWSPDGKRIVFTSDRSGSFELYVMNADGSGVQRLTYSGAQEAFDPAWSPDGSAIAYIKTRYDEEGAPFGRLITIKPDGTLIRDVIGSELPYLENPTWSPSSQSIAVDYASRYYGIFNDVYVYRANGTGGAAVQTNVSITYQDNVVSGWSPDGTYLLYNQIFYTVEGNYLVITGTSFQTVCMQAPGIPCEHTNTTSKWIDHPPFAFLPDWQSGDIIPPQTSLQSLPPLWRGNGVALQWDSHVDGVASLVGYNMQMKQGAGGAWSNVNFAYPFPTFMINKPNAYLRWLTPGDTLYFRVQGVDEAQNAEPWNANPGYDAKTTLYTWQMGGHLWDNAGNPIGGQELSLPTALNPVTTANDGAFNGYLTGSGDTVVDVTVPGYGSLPATSRELSVDVDQPLLLPPADNIVSDGTFEAVDLSAWTVSGTLDAALTTQDARRATGAQSLALGSDCAYPCSPSVTAPSINGNKVVAMGPDGTLYALIDTPFDGLFYSSMPPGGTWSEPTLLWLQPEWHVFNLIHMYITFDAEGRPIFAWDTFNRPGGDGVFSARWAGYWEINMRHSGAVMYFIIDPDLTVVAFASVYDILYADQSVYQLHMYTHPFTSDPSDDLVAYGDIGQSGDSVAALRASDGTLHILWRDYSGVYARSRDTNGTWSPIHILGNSMGGYRTLKLIEDAQGIIHANFRSSDFYYAYRTLDGLWSIPQVVPFNFMLAKALPDGAVVATGSNVVTPCATYIRRAGSNWSTLTCANLSYVDTTYFYSGMAESDGEVVLEQSLDLTRDLTSPRLAFLSQLRSLGEHPDSYLSASIVDGETVTPLVTLTSDHAWKPSSAALDAWMGKTVILRFILHQAAGEPVIEADLDDVSVGSWQAPRVMTVEPAHFLYDMNPQTIVITGQNFIQAPAVRIGAVAIPAENIHWINATRLEIDPPANLQPGLNTVTVINPGGQANALVNGVYVGVAFHIPVIIR